MRDPEKENTVDVVKKKLEALDADYRKRKRKLRALLAVLELEEPRPLLYEEEDDGVS